MICVITGATGGLGGALAERAAHQGYDLVLQGRSERRLAALRDQLARERPGLSVETVVGDLDSAAGARDVARQIAAIAPEIDLLFNNAGVLLDGVQMSEDGLEMHTQVNLIAPYILMETLKPNLSSRQGSIINVSSGMALKARTLSAELLQHPKKAQKLTGAYARSKLALSVVTQARAAAFEAEGVTLACADPGPNKTSMTSGDGMPAILKLIRPLIYAAPETGARKLFQSLDAAKSFKDPGAFFSGRRAKSLPSFAQTNQIAEMVLAFCKRHAGE